MLWPTWAAFAAIMLFHALTITSARFRIPIEPLSFVWIATGFFPALTHLVRRFGIAWLETREEEEDAATTAIGKHQLAGPHVRRTGVGSRSILRRR